MAKLDKMQFAKVLVYIAGIVQRQNMDSADVSVLDEMIDIDAPQSKQEWVEVEKVDELLRQLNAPNGFIPAIKAYRVLTGAGLKESKETIERYRNVKPDISEPATLGDVLAKATK